MFTEYDYSDEAAYELRQAAYGFRDLIDDHSHDPRWAARLNRLRVLIEEAGREVAAISLECDKALGEIT
jgi:hypothetical protein